ncbi:hypothetical protein V1504DRAFT_471707 [Lipomyces starkeyi]
MLTTHFVTNIDKLVADALEGLTLTNSDVLYYKKDKVILLTKAVIAKKSHNLQTHVAIISAGGAGHEPSHAAFVGEGMLTAAASGWIFCSANIVPAEFVSAVKLACEKVIGAEPLITQYDAVVGDGDCGYTLKRGRGRALVPHGFVWKHLAYRLHTC